MKFLTALLLVVVFAAVPAQAQDSSSSIAQGLTAFGGLLTIVAIIYGIMCFFVPIFIWLILQRIEDCLRELRKLTNSPEVAKRSSSDVLKRALWH